MPTDAPDGLLNQHVVTGSAKARKAKAKSADTEKAPDDDGKAAPAKSVKAK